MTVFSYFDAEPGLQDQGQVIRLWHDSWKRRGWEPRLLTPRNARQHPWFDRAQEAIGAEVATPSFSKWFALDGEASGTAFLVDYGVMNFQLRPFHARGPFSSHGKECYAVSRPSRRLYLRKLIDPSALLPLILMRAQLCGEHQDGAWQELPLVRFYESDDNQPPRHRTILNCGRPLY